MSEFWNGKQDVYSPLNTAFGEIKLLTLLPANFGTEICVKLTTEKLEKPSSLDYEALSYTWGSAENPVFIRINDFDHLPVTRNLEEALQHLRYADQPRTLWIDAICVNQEDLDERSEQVPRMADIFASAKRVVLWLGPAADQSSVAIQTLKKIGSMIVVDLFKAWMEPSEEAKEKGELQWADRNTDIPLPQIEFVQILNFFNRPWFERLWIRQEVRLATHLILICGLDTLSWNHFLNAVFCLEAKKPAYSYRLGQYEDDWFQRVTLVWGLCGTGLRQDFPAQVDIAKYSKCSDPRDRVYALLSTSDMAMYGIKISPNYRKSVDEVYQEVFLQFAKGYQNSLMSLYILTAAETKDFSLNRPTWVPDWATVRLSYLFPIFKACGMSYSKVTYIGGGILKTWGVIKSTIKTAHLSGLTQDPCPVDDVMNSIRQLSRQALLTVNEGSSPETYINSGDQQ